ncbi:hypothetical protein [Pararhodobacter oceanensis]|uniref:hypothetical protein n=1 Tax=Pararhodobacter oceanensis TaxID=2172121 RepID=UPI003A95C57B
MSTPVTLPQLQNMHRMTAALVIADPQYLPLFHRIEREIEAFEASGDAITRARAIAARYKASA